MKRIIAFLIIFFMLAAPYDVSAASGIQITYNGKTTNYTDTKLTIICQGKKIDLAKTPGLLINGTGMFPYQEAFVDSAIGAKASYQKSTKTITMSYGSNKITMKLSSKTAVVNGKKKSMPAAPIEVTYKNGNITTILVPSRFVAENLGLLYSWYSKTGTAAVEKQGLMISYGGRQYNYQGSTIQFKVNKKKITNSFPGIIISGTTLAPAKAVFADSLLKAVYSYDKTGKVLSISHGDAKLVLTMSKSDAFLNGKKVKLPVPPQEVIDQKSNISYVMVPAEYVAEQLGYYYEYDESAKTAEINTEKTESEVPAEDVPNQIQIPKGTNHLSDILTNDDYHNRRFILTMSGDLLGYYQSNQPKIQDENRASVSAVLNEDGNTDIIIQTNLIRAFDIKETNDMILITVKAPKDMYSKIAVVDAGHGGSAPGTLGSTYGNTLVEKEIALSAVRQIKEAADAAGNIKIYYTRLTDTDIANEERSKMANEIEADLFLSIHANSDPDSKDTKGSEVIYSAKYNQQTKSGLTSSKLAYSMLDSLVKGVGSEKRPIMRDNILVLNTAKMPAALLEIAFISNESDASLLQNSDNMKKIGTAIYKGIEDILAKYQTKRE